MFERGPSRYIATPRSDSPPIQFVYIDDTVNDQGIAPATTQSIINVDTKTINEDDELMNEVSADMDIDASGSSNTSSSSLFNLRRNYYRLIMDHDQEQPLSH
ncbi:hypothetical protein CCR75_000567 [Bremia lactucae]|uniref:Uncharacterized protein n=1 Tax=Bremia lactucae TaxID=4779 RepID=A0A976IK70_BRELC|nr:hypothetical protein CCR75_000567 [Bremia lactucae]